MRNPSFRNIIYAFLLLFFIGSTGTIGYMLMEAYTFSEAFYMTVITISTVGFKEVRPLSVPGMWFTSFLIIISFGIFAYVITTFTRYVFDGVFRNYYRDNKVKSKIKKLKGHVIVCGFGRNGKQAKLELLDHNEKVVIVERSEDVIKSIQENPNLIYVQGDATHDDVLGEVQIENAKALITTLPSDADNLFVVLTARQMNPNLTIISRASDDHSDTKLKRAGASYVIMPDKVGGQRMAKLVAQPNVMEFLEYIMLEKERETSLTEITCENLNQCFLNKSIKELDVRNLSGANIVGLKDNKGEYLINPPATFKLTCEDKLFVLGTPEQVEKLKQLLKHSN